MNNTFRITISAVDKATAVVRSVKNSFATVTRPIVDLKSAVSSLGKETGLDRVGKSLLGIADTTSSLASKMSGVFPALGGGIGIAAMAALASHWGDLGTRIERTSRSLDISTGQFQEFEAVARRADVAPEALTGGLKSLASTMQDVFYHRAGDSAMTAIRNMGLEFHKTASGAPDLVRGVDDIADAVQRLKGDSQSQITLLRSLGISDDLLPVFSRGAAGIREYREEYQKTHGMISEGDIKRADAFKDSMINLGDALAGVGTRLAANAADVTDFNNAMAVWIGGGPNPFKGMMTASLFNAPKGKSLADDMSTLGSWWKGTPDAPKLTQHLAENPNAAPFSYMPQVSREGIYLDAPAPASIDGPPPSVQAVTDAAAQQAPKLQIELLLKGAPPGTQARVRTNDGSQIPVRVETSMQHP